MARFQSAQQVVDHFLKHPRMRVVDCGPAPRNAQNRRQYEIYRLTGRVSPPFARYTESELLAWAADWED